MLQNIFTSDIGRDSDVYETVHEGTFLFRVTDVIDSKIKPLEDIREQIISDWKAEEIQQAVNERGVALTAEVNSGKSLEDIAEELGSAATLRERGISRSNPPRDISNPVVADLLSASEGDVVRGVGATKQTYVIAKLDSIVPNQDGLAGEILDVVQRNISAEISLDIQAAYRQDILKNYKLREYPCLLYTSPSPRDKRQSRMPSSA